MADQQNLPTADVDHLAVARNLLEGRGDAGYDAVQCHALIDIAESLRHLRPDVAVAVAPAGRSITIAEEDWPAVYQAGLQVVDEGMYFPADLIAELRGALDRKNA